MSFDLMRTRQAMISISSVNYYYYQRSPPASKQHTLLTILCHKPPPNGYNGGHDWPFPVISLPFPIPQRANISPNLFSATLCWPLPLLLVLMNAGGLFRALMYDSDECVSRSVPPKEHRPNWSIVIIFLPFLFYALDAIPYHALLIGG